MSIEGRKSIHKNNTQINTQSTPVEHSSQEHLPEDTSFEFDESLLQISDIEVTNKSLIIPRHRSTTQSPSPPGKTVQRHESCTGNESQKYSTFAKCSTRRLNTNKTKKETVSTVETTKKTSNLWMLIIAIAVAAVIISMCLHNATLMHSSIKRCTFSDLRVKYKNEDYYLWTHLTSGIENILNDRSDKPAVFLLVHSGGKVAKKLIKDIAKSASTCFDSSIKPVEIEAVDFTSEEAAIDYGFVIEKYKQKIREGNVILIANLNEIPAEAARALHAICDTYNPIVPKVIILLSLIAENKGERAVDTAQEALRELWESKIKLNELDPLIARVTDEVISLQSK